jgi:hypothetical protein
MTKSEVTPPNLSRYDRGKRVLGIRAQQQLVDGEENRTHRQRWIPGLNETNQKKKKNAYTSQP